jgi:hypothetical protein
MRKRQERIENDEFRRRLAQGEFTFFWEEPEYWTPREFWTSSDVDSTQYLRDDQDTSFMLSPVGRDLDAAESDEEQWIHVTPNIEEALSNVISGFAGPRQVGNYIWASIELKETKRPKVPKLLVESCFPQHGIWDPGATSDMGSISAVVAVDRELQKVSNGILKGTWYVPSFPRTFRVANGKTIAASYEVQFEIPLAKSRGENFLKFRVAAVDTGKTPETQVPWLFSNESGEMIGAKASSRTGIIESEENLVQGWKIQMARSHTGHWLFPLVQGFVDLATPWGEDRPIRSFNDRVAGVPPRSGF